MLPVISKIKLINYKRFELYTIKVNSKMNIFVGDNEAGKSSVLEAIDLVASGNMRKAEALGIHRLLNIGVVKSFIGKSDRQFDDLPKMIIELYLNGEFDHTMKGNNNSDKTYCNGIRLICEANVDYKKEINESILKQDDYFPYDYYSFRFSTFADEGYSGYKKKVRTALIDSANMNSEYATSDFIRRMYNQYTEDDIKERAVHKSKYRQLKDGFQKNNLQELNARVPTDKNYSFGLRQTSALSLESDLMIFEDHIGIDSKGSGKQVFIKTDFALERTGTNVDVVLIEEPENHLSHVNLRRLIQRVSEAQGGQIFIATHNSLISTRLELRNLLIMNAKNHDAPISLQNLSEETEKYFLKAPAASILEFTLASRVILVEGPSEYMLFEKFYESTENRKPEEDEVHIVNVRGLSFKRYLDIAKLLGIKVAVVTDNDHDMQKHCIEKYAAYSTDENIKIFFDADNEKHTFEIVLYEENKNLCDKVFGINPAKRMIENKTESAYSLVSQSEAITVPKYIIEAIKWIRS